MTDEQGSRDSKISLRGFSKESIEMIRELETFGWVFRPSNHGVVGRAPNDKTTISISRNLNKTNRSLKRAQAEFKRWLRFAHPEMIEVANSYVADREEADAESDPVIAGILERRALSKTKEKIDNLTDPIVRDRLTRLAQEQIAQTAQTQNGEVSVASITDVEPMHFKKSKDDLARVMRRTWSTGKVDFACAFPECQVTSSNARSVSQHYGAVHTRPIHTYTNTAPIEPESTETTGLPWEALAETVEELREAEPAPAEPADVEPVQFSEESLATGELILPDAVAMLMAVQGIVSRPLLEQMKILADQVSALLDENNDLVKERDEAREAYAKIQADWDALRSLVAGIKSD